MTDDLEDKAGNEVVESKGTEYIKDKPVERWNSRNSLLKNCGDDEKLNTLHYYFLTGVIR